MDKSKEAKYKGELEIGNIIIPCAVLADSTRVIGENGISKNLGQTGGKSYKLRDKMQDDLGGPIPIFLASKALEPFIDGTFDDMDLKPIEYTIEGKKYVGYNANILPKVCEVWLKAREQGTLQKSQLPKAKNAEILMRGLARVGITALVDEATGYQYDREKNELQKILKAYITEELLPWQKRFPDIFYRELFRLNGWDFTVNGIKKRPVIVGKWTNTLIYKQLPKGVNDELRKSTPKNSKGKFSAKLHQSLTTDIGHPHLSAQINQVLAIFTISDNMKEMWYNFNKMNQRKMGQLEMEFKFDEKGHTISDEEPIKLSDFDENLNKALSFNPKEY